MEVRFAGNVKFGDMNATYPRVVQAPLRISDMLDTISPAAYGNIDGIEFDQLCGCTCAAQVFVPHDQKVNASITVIDKDQHLLGVETTTWDTVAVTPANPSSPTPPYWCLQHVMANNAGFQTMDLQCSDVTQANTMTLNAATAAATLLGAQGVRFFITRASHVRIPATVGASWSVRWKIGDTWYMLEFTNAAVPAMAFSSDDESTWTWLRGAFKVGADSNRASGNVGPNLEEAMCIDVRLLNGTMVVTAGGDTAPAVIPMNDATTPYTLRIDRLRVKARAFTHMSWSAHLVKRRAVGAFISIPHQMGDVPDVSTPLTYELIGGDDTLVIESGVLTDLTSYTGSQVTITTVDGDTMAPAYSLSLTNVEAGEYGADEAGDPIPYADGTAIISRIVTVLDQITAPPTGVYTTWDMRSGDADQPIQQVVESKSFNPGAMTIESSCAVTIQNWQGIDYLRSRWGLNGVGNVALSVALGYQHTGVFDRFFGYCDRYQFNRPAAGTANITMMGCDLMQMFREQTIFAPPILDGYNHYAAVAYLAAFAGISLAQCGFAGFVPTDPYTSAGADPDPYFLPVGMGNNPWTPIRRSATVMELLQMIQQKTGFLLFVDNNGMLRYEAWIPAAAAISAKRTFGDCPTDDGSLAEMWSLSCDISTREVRNNVVLIGIDAFNPQIPAIVIGNKDEASIWSAPGAQPYNYKGFMASAVMMDSMFANRAFAESSAWKLYRWLRQPSFTVTLATWAQPDVYPLDVLYITDPRGLTGTLPFYVMSMQTSYSALSGSVVPSCTITARYLDPTALAP